MSPQEVAAFIRARCEDDGGCLRYVPVKAKTTINRKRHPIFFIEGKVVLGRRTLYEAERGQIKPGYYLVPNCGDEFCIEPKHQKQISQRQKNAIGGTNAKQSATKGERCAEKARKRATSKLDMEKAREIRASDESHAELARRYGVDDRQIWAIRNNLAWKEYRSPFAGLFSGLIGSAA